jgi:hypothetical protein
MEEERGQKRKRTELEEKADLERQKRVLQSIIKSIVDSMEYIGETFREYLATKWESQDPEEKEFVMDCTASAALKYCDYHLKFLTCDKWKEEKEEDWP